MFEEDDFENVYLIIYPDTMRLTPLDIFCVPLRPLHLPFAQIILEKQMLKNITKIRKQKIINHTKQNSSTVLRKYSTLLKLILKEKHFLFRLPI